MGEFVGWHAHDDVGVPTALVSGPWMARTSGQEEGVGKRRTPSSNVSMVTGVFEYVIPGAWLGGADAARWLGNPAIDFLAGLEGIWSNNSGREYSQWRAGLVLKTGWRF